MNFFYVEALNWWRNKEENNIDNNLFFLAQCHCRMPELQGQDQVACPIIMVKGPYACVNPHGPHPQMAGSCPGKQRGESHAKFTMVLTCSVNIQAIILGRQRYSSVWRGWWGGQQLQMQGYKWWLTSCPKIVVGYPGCSHNLARAGCSNPQ